MKQEHYPLRRDVWYERKQHSGMQGATYPPVNRLAHQKISHLCPPPICHITTLCDETPTANRCFISGGPGFITTLPLCACVCPSLGGQRNTTLYGVQFALQDHNLKLECNAGSNMRNATAVRNCLRNEGLLSWQLNNH
jgi:hypothetical protein